MPLDLDRFSDLDVLRVLGEDRPEFVDILAAQMDRGRSDEQIVALVCEAGGSAQMMRYAKKCLRALRSLAKEASAQGDPNEGGDSRATG